MKKNLLISNTFRIVHRYLGFFLAGIMMIYAISGVILIFRETDFLKREKQIEKTVAASLSGQELGRALKIRDLKVEREEGNLLYFPQGSYDKSTGEARYKAKELPFLLEKFTRLHKATHKQPLYFFNIFFGISLLFFAISSFWMFLPGTTIFRKGLYFTLGGLLLALLMLFWGS
ncbi:MAG: hypothetical protein RI973_1081 [Bacteroidota bacterium]|jgi:hypothetical protein